MVIDGKVALITGASEGIGAATAEEFQRRGARLSLAARSGDKLAAVGGPDAVRTAGDLRDPEVRRRAVEATLEKFGRVDILVNNAGVGMYAPLWRAPIGEIRRMFELNVLAAVSMAQHVVEPMKRQGGGMLVNVSSIAGLVPLPWFTLYSGTKFALCAIGDGLRTELKPFGIRVVTICPGYVRTRFQQNVLIGKPPAALQRVRRWTISPEQCATAIAGGVEREPRTVIAPGSGRVLALAWRLFPGIIDSQLERIYRTLDIAE